MSTIDVYDFLVMLIATQGKNIAATQQYFEEVLTRGDYYLGQEVTGRWHGRGADILGLEEGALVTKDQFNQLLEGKHPRTGKRLTQRQRQDRRPGVDLTFSVPKSVSLAWAVLEDERVIEALRRAVHDTMRHDIEPLMHRRVRAGEHAATQQKSRTGKLIYADFLHKTSRPVDGLADPHLHIHAYVVNWTEQDGKHYAGELEEIVRQRQSLQAKFEARLARTLQYELGYSVEASRYFQGGKLKTGWELAGFDRPLIEKFSRRTAQVEQYAAEHGVQEPDEKAQLGKLTREKKDTGQTVAQLRVEWFSRLTVAERAVFTKLWQSRAIGKKADDQAAAIEAVNYALDHHLYRQSTVERHQITGTALEQGLTLSPTTIAHALDEMDVIQRSMDVEGAERRLVTTGEVLEAERAMIAFARDGRGTRKSIGTPEYEISREWLNEQQQMAVRSVLESRDTVMAISGGAGTGKTSLMQEAVEAVHQHGKQVFTFAPSTGAKEVLIENGFHDAQKRMASNPLLGMERLNAQEDIRHERRALLPEEFEKLVNSARTSGVAIQCFDGEQRARIYILSYMTGLRRKELGSLTPRSFDLEAEPPTVTVEAACSKHRRKDVLPLHADLVTLLGTWLDGVTPDEVLFPKLGKRRTWLMVKKDLERAGIPYRDEQNRVADFHAAGRHTHITELLRNGASVPEAKELARHTDVRMTMKYTHIGIDDQAKAVAKLPAAGSWLHYGCSSKHADRHSMASGDTTQPGRDSNCDNVTPAPEHDKTQKSTGWHKMAQPVLTGGGGNRMSRLTTVTFKWQRT